MLNPAYAIEKSNGMFGFAIESFFSNSSRGFNLNYIIFIFLNATFFFLIIIRDVCSRAASMEVLVRLKRKNKHFHARANHSGLETDVKLDWVTVTCYGSV